jgi:hypothetical protein
MKDPQLLFNGITFMAIGLYLMIKNRKQFPELKQSIFRHTISIIEYFSKTKNQTPIKKRTKTKTSFSKTHFFDETFS